MLEIILWVVLGLVALIVALLGLMVVVGYVTQIAYLEHLDDWNHHD